MRHGIFSRPKKERQISGDACIVQEGEGTILFGLIDGLGSGEEAARAASSPLPNPSMRPNRIVPSPS